MHSGKGQEHRTEALKAFKDGQYQVLVATDVVGRGIDISGVTVVVNFELPKDIDKYRHRVGRTGRAGKKGLAISFLTDKDTDIMYDLKEALRDSNNVVPHELASHPAALVKPGTVSDRPARKAPMFTK